MSIMEPSPASQPVSSPCARTPPRPAGPKNPTATSTTTGHHARHAEKPHPPRLAEQVFRRKDAPPHARPCRTDWFRIRPPALRGAGRPAPTGLGVSSTGADAHLKNILLQKNILLE